ncbi:MAG: amino acid ABC transporter permease [Firmicutes bacterium]|nr:amino acid ABC transporter permease [Bacillota bacterium]
MPLGFFDYISANMPLILNGLKFTVKLWALVIIIMLPLSTICAIAKVSGPKWLKTILGAYTWIFRGSPLILQLYLAYFGLPYLGIVLEPMTVVVTVFILCVVAYQTEIIRGGILSTDKGQYEACKALGMSYPQTMFRVVVPQTIRKILPQTCSEVIVAFKDTCLVSAIGLGDLLRSARELVIGDLRVDAFAVVLVFYLLVSSILVLIFDKLEKKYSVYV